MGEYMRIEDLDVYNKLCQLHIDVCNLTRDWPRDERFELVGQLHRSSNSSPAQLAEKHSDGHVRNKIEGVNRSRGEALESVHHLYMGMLKAYHSEQSYCQYRDRYHECVRMLNGMERTLERQLPPEHRRFPDSPEP
jgi:four helix bundle protein